MTTTEPSVDEAVTGPPAGEPPAEAAESSSVTDVQPVALPDLGADAGTAPTEAQHDVGLLADIDVELSVELGRAQLPLRRLLTLTPGSLVDLDRSPGTVVDILVNGLRIARGEVVVVDGDFGVRVTEIVARRDPT